MPPLFTVWFTKHKAEMQASPSFISQEWGLIVWRPKVSTFEAEYNELTCLAAAAGVSLALALA